MLAAGKMESMVKRPVVAVLVFPAVSVAEIRTLAVLELIEGIVQLCGDTGVALIFVQVVPSIE